MTYAPPDDRQTIEYYVMMALRNCPSLREVNHETKAALAEYVHRFNQCDDDTIWRTARDVRKHHPELQGKDWDKHQSHARKTVAAQITNHTWGRKPKEKQLESFNEMKLADVVGVMSL